MQKLERPSHLNRNNTKHCHAIKVGSGGGRGRGNLSRLEKIKVKISTRNFDVGTSTKSHKVGIMYQEESAANFCTTVFGMVPRYGGTACFGYRKVSAGTVCEKFSQNGVFHHSRGSIPTSGACCKKLKGHRTSTKTTLHIATRTKQGLGIQSVSIS